MLVYNPARDFKIGEKIEIIPYHVCSTVNLHEELVCVRNGEVEAVWPILARGKAR
jgi:D-serine deaminase-like pyridoxal phosphate-dependent protein